jgi:hypothetical protein
MKPDRATIETNEERSKKCHFYLSKSDQATWITGRVEKRPNCLQMLRWILEQRLPAPLILCFSCALESMQRSIYVTVAQWAVSKLLTQTESAIFRTLCIFGVAIDRLLFNIVFGFMVLMLCEFWRMYGTPNVMISPLILRYVILSFYTLFVRHFMFCPKIFKTN